MKKSLFITFIVLFITFGYETPLFAQENPDDIALIDSELENNFYYALQQRAIENYDRAVTAVEKCIEKQPDNAALYYELGKNHYDLKNYIEAENAFKKAIELNSNERWYWNGLYDVYYKTKEYKKSIEIVKKLIEFDPNMREDLVSLYMYTRQNEKALELLNEIEKTSVLSKTMEYYKLKLSENTNKAVVSSQKDERSLLKAIESNPKVEQNYLDLMLLYSKEDKQEQLIGVANKLAKEIPSSEWAAISLYKVYLDEQKGKEAAAELLKVLRNKKVDILLKHKLLNEFLIFSADATQYDAELEQAVDILSDESSLNVAKEIAKFYYNKNNYEKTSFFLEKALSSNPDDWESIDLLLNTLNNSKNYEELVNRSLIFIDLYPAQPKLYFYAGLGYNKLGKAKLAIENLETGLEFVVEDPELEGYFHKQLADAYTALGNSKKASYHQNEMNKSVKN